MSKVKIQGNASGTGTFTISAPNSNTDRSLTLPDGAGEILTDAAIGTSVLAPDGDGSNLTGISGGKVLQVVFANLTTVSTFSASTSWRDSGLTVTITPSSTSSKIFITGQLSAGFNTSDQGYGVGFSLLRNSTALGLGNVSGTTATFGCVTTGSNDDDFATAPFSYLDSPSTTSATTYKLQVLGRDEKSFTINAGGDYADDSNTHRRLIGTSTITVMEIAG